MSLATLKGMDAYLRAFGPTLGRKAIHALNPLHNPETDGLPDFSDLLREPFEPQKHAIAAITKMLDAEGSGFLCGEMGTGKTLMGMVAIHRHACRPRRQGGLNGKYRALVLCPDHLIKKWEREIVGTIEGARVSTFDSWKDVVGRLGHGRQALKEIAGQGKSTVRQEVGRWPVPLGAEWYILGRNQAKWMPDWIGIGEAQRGFDGRSHEGGSSRTIVIAKVPRLDAQGRPVDRRTGPAPMRAVTARVIVCPECGHVPRDKRGIPLSIADVSRKQTTCEGRYLREVGTADRHHSGLDILRPMPARFADAREGRVLEVGPVKYRVEACGEPLWNWTGKGRRWAPARFIHKKLARMFPYLIIDEVHEQKSDESAQSMAAGKLMAAAKHTLALTGTIIGGYADHLFPLMVRMTPDTLRAEGFEWGKDLPFSEAYGRVDRIVTTSTGGGREVTVGRNQHSMRKSSGRSTERKAVRPGVMPALFGRHMIGTSLFVTLAQMADELPDLDEYIGDHATGSTACAMDDDQRDEYRRVEAILTSACKELLRTGSMKLLGAMLFTLLDYPDMPHGWEPEWEGELAVGYYNRPNDRTKQNWIGVVSPAGLDAARVRPKERALIDICRAEKAAGRQTWVYTQMTGVRDIQPRLRRLLEAEGLRVAVLRPDTAKMQAREAWIAKNGTDYDVIISHPKLVSTGMDLFSKDEGGHNFPTLVFYQTGYNLFDMRQASRRSWRIGQPLDCKVYYLYYKDCMQHRAMQLMSRKMVAAAALEGEFSTEGLVAMAGDDNAQMALARSLSQSIDDADIGRSWGKVKGGARKAKPPEGPVEVKPGPERPHLSLFDGRIPPPGEPSPLDDLPMAARLVAETILTHPPRPAVDDLDFGDEEMDVDVPSAVGEADDATGPTSARPTPSPPTAHRPAPGPAEEDDFDDDLDDDLDDDPIPTLSRESLARLFANRRRLGTAAVDRAG